jgi:predicted enzyme involved in methoxymalonyl-ACP biosynthesis
VIGRTVETALLSLLAEAARELGSTSLLGRFVPTAKNAPARDLFPRHGFRCTREEPDGSSRWQLALADAPSMPAWFSIHRVEA